MNDPLTTTILRVTTGTIFLLHGILKITLFTVPGTVAFFATAGFPGWLAYPTIFVEIVGGTLVIAGFFSRYVSMAFIPILAGAFLTHWPNGFLFTMPNGGWEFPALMLVLVFVQTRIGDGAYALSRIGTMERRTV